MKRFPRPNLFDSWAGVATWTLVPLLLLAAAGVALVVGPEPGRIAAALMAAGTLGALVARFAPRIADIRAVAYRTRQGVAVVARDRLVPPARELVEAALERAIAAHGHREALDGFGLLLTARVFVSGTQVHGVEDAGWLNVAVPSYQTESVTLGLITHEASHALLTAAGVPVREHHAIMAKAGTI